MSLDDAVESIIDIVHYTFRFKFLSSTTVLQFTGDEIQRFAERCGYFRVLSTTCMKCQDQEFNLTQFEVQAFMQILPYLQTGLLPIFTNTDDVCAIQLLALFLDMDDQFNRRCQFDAEHLFQMSLTDTDKKLVAEERELRQMIFGEEERDFHFLDQLYELTELMKAMQYTVDEKFDGQQLIASHPQSSQTYYYTLQGSAYTQVLTCPSKFKYNHIIHTDDAGATTTTKGYPMFGKACKIPLIASNLNTQTFLDVLLSNVPGFTGFNWTNVCIAGGSLFKLLYFGKLGRPSCLDRRSNYLLLPYSIYGEHEDVDLFITTKSHQEALAVIHRTLAHFQQTMPGVKFMRTKHVITAYDERTLIEIQIILRLYNSITQVISGFDLDSCCIAFDGQQFYGMPRFVRSLQLGYNLVDPERQSPSYAKRLLKYAHRGFKIAFPGLDAERVVTASIKNINSTGLAKLLRRLKHSTPTTKMYPKYELQNVDMEHTVSDYIVNEIAIGTLYLFVKEYLIDHIRCAQRAGQQTQVYAAADVQLALLKDRREYSYSYDRLLAFARKYQIRVPFVYSSNVDTILNSSDGYNDNFVIPIGQGTHETQRVYPLPPSNLPATIEFKTHNAGTQMTNSFHPTTENWYRDIYTFVQVKLN